MDINKLEDKLKELGQPAFRLKQIEKAIFQDGVSAWSEITTLSKDLREKLEKEIPILSFSSEKVLESKEGDSFKALLKLTDGNCIETVLIQPKPDMWSVCVSCQVGCPLNCRFCATGASGFTRDLTSEEITDQVLFWRQWLFKKDKNNKLDNVVDMGMGEPFLNWQSVKESLENLINPELFGFGSRSISVSTAGVAEGIENFAEDFPQMNLALSLHFATDEKRDKFMPVNQKYNLEKVRKALKKYFSLTNRKVFIEYILLDGINDSSEDARALVQFLKSIGKLQLLHVNLIRYNTAGGGLTPSNRERTQRFKDALVSSGIPATIRKSLGDEVQGACGQLAGK
jgi:23S rRNA (adenine2503-C2)-methyltransferase